MLSIVLAGLVFSPFAGSSGVATYASIRGTVTTGYPDYKPVANAQVMVAGAEDTRQTRTDANGHYYFLTLLPGVYRVSVPSVTGTSMAGHKTAMLPGTPGPRQRQCLENANAPVELSAGLAYFANFDLITNCA